MLLTVKVKHRRPIILKSLPPSTYLMVFDRQFKIILIGSLSSGLNWLTGSTVRPYAIAMTDINIVTTADKFPDYLPAKR